MQQRMSHFTFQEILVRQLCHIEVSFELHQSVASRKCDTIEMHLRECQMVGIVCTANIFTECAKCEAPFTYFPEIVSRGFTNKSSSEEEEMNICTHKVNSLLHSHLKPKEDVKEVQYPKDMARESVETGESDIVQVN